MTSTPRIAKGVALALGSIAFCSSLAHAQVPTQFSEVRRSQVPVVNATTIDVAVGDFDLDGDLDVAHASAFGPAIILSNDGFGVFDDVSQTAVVDGPTSGFTIDACDLDGDGDLDLVHAGPFAVLINDGSGTFTDESAVRLPDFASRTGVLRCVDVDSDGDPDIVIGGLPVDGPGDLVLINNGTGVFTLLPDALPFDTSSPFEIVPIDVEPDGDLDVFIVRSGLNRLYLNNGSGSFTAVSVFDFPRDDANAPFSRDAVAFDIDADGDADLVIGNENRPDTVFVNMGGGTFVDESATRLPRDEFATSSVTPADLDLDGDLDVIVTTSDPGPCRFYLNDGNGFFTVADSNGLPVVPERVNAAAVFDADLDGDEDVLFVVTGPAMTTGKLFLRSGDQDYVDSTPNPLPREEAMGRDVAVADIDLDGDLDLLVGEELVSVTRSTLQVLLNDGEGRYESALDRVPLVTDQTITVLAGDLDLDGDADLLAVQDDPLEAPTNQVLINDGAGFFVDERATRFPILTGRGRVQALADVDGDGDPDVIAASDAGPILLINDGSGVFAVAPPGAIPPASARVERCVFEDVDVDGDLDLAFLSRGAVSTAQEPNLFLNDGLGVFQDVTEERMPDLVVTGPALRFSDVDGDGDPDLLVTNFIQNRLLLNDGNGIFVDSTQQRLPESNRAASDVVFLDLDLDGDPDMVTSDFNFRRQNRAFLNDGAGVFTEDTERRLPMAFRMATRVLAVADLDSDRDQDLVFIRPFQDQVLFNLRRQISSRQTARLGALLTIDFYSRAETARGFDVAVPVFALDVDRIPVGAFGTLLVAPEASVVGPPVLLSQPSGTTSIELEVPAAAALAGLRLSAQALLQIPFPIELSLTNRVSFELIP